MIPVSDVYAKSSRAMPNKMSRWGPQGFWGSGENGYLFSGSWGALVIIFSDLGSKLIDLGI